MSIGSSTRHWGTGVAAGAVAAVVTGLVVWYGMDEAVIASHIPGTLGLDGAFAGWVLFLGIGAVLGLIYAAVAGTGPLRAYAAAARTGGLLGLGYGLAWWVVAVVAVPLLVGDGVAGIGSYAVTLEGVLGWALLGVLVGFAYQAIPRVTG